MNTLSLLIIIFFISTSTCTLHLLVSGAYEYLESIDNHSLYININLYFTFTCFRWIWIPWVYWQSLSLYQHQFVFYIYLFQVEMNTLGLLIITLSISTSIFYTVYCTCGVTYLSSCQPGVYQPSSEHISRTELVGNYAQCIDLCNSYKNECLSLDLRSFNNGSYSCQIFNTLGRSNCAITPRTQHYTRVGNI